MSKDMLGYLMIASPVPNTFIGGAMVVDAQGLPVEFRYTEPIQPTKIQQILYGAALSRYIKTHVILETLLKSLDTKPGLMIVTDDSLLDETTMDKLGFPVARLTETKLGPLGAAGEFERVSSSEVLLQLTPESNPIRVQLPKEAPDPVAPGAPKSLPDKSASTIVGGQSDFTQHPAYGLLTQAGRWLDILEPVKRVEKALGALCQEAGLDDK